MGCLWRIRTLLCGIFCMYMLDKSVWSIVLFNSELALLTFLSIGKGGVWKLSTVSVLNYTCVFMSFMKLDVRIFGIYIYKHIYIYIYVYNCCIFLGLFPLSIWSDLLCFFWLIFFEVCFVRYEYLYSCLFSDSICLENLFPSFHSEPIFVFVSEVHFLLATNCWVLFFHWRTETINIQSYGWKVCINSFHFIVLCYLILPYSFAYLLV
jgi:hypothetical protein